MSHPVLSSCSWLSCALLALALWTGPLGAAETRRHVSWQDPVERAFTVQVPHGWQVRGGIVRPSPLLVQNKVEATSPDGAVQLWMGDNLPLYMEPEPFLEMFGIREGGMYNGLRVGTYQPGAQFVTRTVLPQRTSVIRPREIKEKNRADLVRTLPTLGLSSYEASEVEFTFERDGKAYRGGALCVTHRLALLGGGSTYWYVPALFYYEAPADRASEAADHLLRMALTFRFDTNWHLAQLRGQRDRVRIASDTQRGINETFTAIYRSQQESRDRMLQRASNVRRDVHDLYDPHTGTVYYGESNRFNYYWINGRGERVGTNTHDRPDIDYRPLTILP